MQGREGGNLKLNCYKLCTRLAQLRLIGTAVLVYELNGCNMGSLLVMNGTILEKLKYYITRYTARYIEAKIQA